MGVWYQYLSLREMNIDYMFLLDRLHLCEDDLIGPLSAPWFYPWSAEMMMMMMKAVDQNKMVTL